MTRPFTITAWHPNRRTKVRIQGPLNGPESITTKPYGEWDATDEKYIRDNRPQKSYNEIALFLKRSRKPVWSKAKRMGLTGG